MPTLTRPEGSQPEDFHLSRRAVASMFFTGYAVAALSAEAAPITTDADGLTIEEVVIPNGAAKGLPAYIARPAARGRHPAILVTNEIFGVHDYIKDTCRRLAKLGYVAVAPDFFYRAGVSLPALSDMQAILPVVRQATDAQVDGDVAATSKWLKAQAFVDGGKMGITGFCWGGLVVWRSATVNPDFKAGVAWYGQLQTMLSRAADVKYPVLGLYGGKDRITSDVPAMKEVLKAAGKSGSDIIIYPEAEHGFHADYRASYLESAAKDGWTRMLAHFKANGVG